ncbi:hypothetical protein TNCV_4028971 [Trichonephila clavipes]|nr:hypothetical protein TNCV_4028971 [Trichonephila clavipes]
MKTAGWSTHRVAGQVDRSGEGAVRNCWEQWTREVTHAPGLVPGLERPGRPRGEGSKDHATSTFWTLQ